MTAVDESAELAMQYIRGELSTLRDDMAGIRSDVANIAAELRAFSAEQGPKMAVLAHRVEQVENDVAEMRGDRQRAKAQMWAMAVSVAVALFSALLSGGAQIITGGG